MAGKKKSKGSVLYKRGGTSITGKSAIQLSKNAASAPGKVLKGSKPATLPSKHTRRIIRTHHTLLKQQAIIQRDLDQEIAKELQSRKKSETYFDEESQGPQNEGNSEYSPSNERIEQLKSELDKVSMQIINNGGIEEYQKASISGQNNTRGGDTSKLLMEWLNELGITGNTTKGSQKLNPLSLLEIGSLSVNNACSTKGIFDYIERIDLHSQDPKNIKEQDFMKRPLPNNNGSSSIPETFDIISLSLVVNYVSDPQTRGQMLLRTTEFLNKESLQRLIQQAKPQLNKRIKFSESSDTVAESKSEVDNTNHTNVFPCLFFVLPAPCVTNSRYLTEEHLTKIMHYIGYTKLLKHKVTSKLVYWLWKYGDAPEDDSAQCSEAENASKPSKFYVPPPYVKQELNNMRVQSRYESDNLESGKQRPPSIKGNQKKKAFSKQEVNPGGGRNNFAVTL